MSNANTPFGLRPVGTLTGAPWTGGVRKYNIPAGDSNAMYIGDPVALAGSGSADAMLATVQLATAGATYPILGVIVAFDHDPSDLTLVYRKASTLRNVYVCTDPATIYMVQGDGSAAITYAALGGNGNLSAGSGGSTITGQSGWILSSTAAGSADATYQVQLLSAARTPNNDPTAVYAKWLVKLNISPLNPNDSNNAY